MRVIGMGAVSALGVGLDATAKQLREQRVAPHPVTRFASTLKVPVFEVPHPGNPSRAGGNAIQWLEMAVEEALREAQLDTPESREGLRIGVCVGSTVLCQLHDLDFCAKLRTGEAIDDPTPYRNYVDASPAEWLKRNYSLTGPALTVSNACTSSADALGIARLWLLAGQCDLVIAAGTDSLETGPLDGFHALGVCSPTPCRPFDAMRSGLNLGEGAAVVVLVREDSPLLATHPSDIALCGYGKSADASHITQPLPSGDYLEKAIRDALREANIEPSQIGFVNAHGTGTEANDRVEGQTLARVFGETLHYHSTKGLTGHTLGAAGALEFVFTALMLRSGVAVRSHGFSQLASELTIPPLIEDTNIDAQYALSTSLAFGGSNTALVVCRK
ncbi:MAG: beta-ketoacyl-[acyl-carrier-protein] synthase family protein [Victivallales bacterium]|nr:beta-ketoacyl-[acyl-carrier-protein] synthase family protein [Victivallales bacterium]